ncbi:MAG: PTS sugar transporter subunit IIB [Olsenella sp.]|jgi:PTS system mannose-specific IIB component|nr:PTS sugar transporter subunit IIB [Olsenella sp.]MCI1644774.1 PTS sugar transporter subunit IIB [Olsenella sp.]MCI1793840.1 PTS sugar transporter subunit IIB [Olsenella sp.]MCI1811391.1 PTS sugar transporter subunit IIB [Olsenella sp.]MCI1879967.1 PTS sugar transporter subunit IIB [Olsenella sp.]
MIVGVRIDFRLIHGQVANLWANTKQVTRFMVVDDEVSQDATQKQVLRMATPASCKLSVLSVEKAAENIKAGKYDAQRLFIVAKKPETLLRLIRAGVELTEINVGNMTATDEVKRIGRNIGMDAGDIAAFQEIESLGTVHLFMQMAPSNPAEDFEV